MNPVRGIETIITLLSSKMKTAPFKLMNPVRGIETVKGREYKIWDCDFQINESRSRDWNHRICFYYFEFFPVAFKLMNPVRGIETPFLIAIAASSCSFFQINESRSRDWNLAQTRAG